ncbi:MAG: DUF6799 domain-containing protein [Bacteroidia bacterium]
MKKLTFAITVLSFSSGAYAQIDSSDIHHNIRYCAQMKDGLMVVVDENNNEISSKILTDNGTVIESNGNIIRKDGVTTALKEGECINTQGIVVRLTNKTENKKTETKVTAKQKP